MALSSLRRGVVRIRGATAPDFLHNITTNNVPVIGEGPRFAVMLNNKGRAAYDFLVHRPTEDELLLDVHRKATKPLLKLLGKFNLRNSALEISDASADWNVVVGMRHSEDQPGAKQAVGRLSAALEASGHSREDHGQVWEDPRCPSLGARAITPSAVAGSAEAAAGDWVHRRQFDLLRALAGVPEHKDGRGTVPLEWNLEELGGIVWDKGCYIGQELMARTHFKGILRKRMVPVLLDSPASLSAEEAQVQASDLVLDGAGRAVAPRIAAAGLRTGIDRSKFAGLVGGAVRPTEGGGRRAGKLVSLVKGSNLGFAMVRMEHLQSALGGGGLQVSAAEKGEGEVTVAQPLLPPFWPQAMALQAEAEDRLAGRR